MRVIAWGRCAAVPGRPVAPLASLAVGTEKRERQKVNRQARLAAAAEAADRARRRQRLTTYGILGAVVVGAILLFAFVIRDDDDDEPVADEFSTTTLAPLETTTLAPLETTTAVPTVQVTAPPAGAAVTGETECPAEDGSSERTTSFEQAPPTCIDEDATYTAEVVTSKGSFTIELDTEIAPLTVNNFVTLARYHYYDGVAFHRIIPGFVVQGGDAVGDPPGTGNPGYEFADELPTGEAPFYEVGSLAMANSGANSNGSQFFIVTGEQGAALPNQYSRFGIVTEGLDVVLAIEASGSPNGSGQPTEEVVIESITITES